MNEHKIILTPEKAIEMLPEGETIHTFINPGTNILMGADWSRKSVLSTIEKAYQLELAGEHAQRMNHGLAVWRSKTDLVFIETKEAA